MNEESRWRDRAGVVHAMVRAETGRYPRGSRWWIPRCGFHAETLAFHHKKRCPLDVTCVVCLGLA